MKEIHAIPSADVWAQQKSKPVKVNAQELFSSGKQILIGVPAAFSPTCNDDHIPGYAKIGDQLRARGVDSIWVMAVNDFFTMQAWLRFMQLDATLFRYIADLDQTFTTALGSRIDLREAGLGVRCSRFAMVINNGQIVHVADEKGAGLAISDAASVLQHC